MALNAATAAWIKRTLAAFVRGELGPLRFLAPKPAAVETEGTETPAAIEADGKAES